MKILTVAVALTAAALASMTAAAQVLYTLESPGPEEVGNFGRSVSSAGDVNNDGYPDLIVGAQAEDGGTSQAGRAYVINGNGASLLYGLESPNPEVDGSFGWTVSELGDVNGDGCDDVAVGTPYEDGGAYQAGRAYIFSGNGGGLLFTLESPNMQAYGYFGGSVSGAGDVNGDGYPDVVVGADGEDAGASHAGRAYIFSGQSGGFLYTLQSPNPESFGLFGYCVSEAGDLNDDGHEDLMVGAWCEDGGATDAGRAYVFSGDGLGLLFTLQSPNAEDNGWFGHSVSSARDANADGHDDVVVGARGEDAGAVDAGRAYVFSGDGGGLLYTLTSPDPQYIGYFGHSVSGAGDVNNDTYDDAIVGAPREDTTQPEAGRAYIFSGNDGSLLYALVSPSPEGYASFGNSVACARDLNLDAHSEVIVGAGYESGGAPGAGRAYVFNGIEVPIELASFTGEPCDGGVRLVWLTLTERDNLGFNVERALDRTGAFVRLTERIIPGSGTSTVPHSYEYFDRSVQPGALYWYRLEDLSLDGESTHHGPIQVAVPDRPELGLQVLGGPDPAFVLRFARSGRASLRLYDVRGKLVATLWEGEASAGGSTRVQPEVRRELPTGLYTASLEQSDRAVRRPVVIAR
jgi:hypothetical protein